MIFSLTDIDDFQQMFSTSPITNITGNALIDAVITSILNRVDLIEDGYQIREDLHTSLPGLSQLAAMGLEFGETWERLEYFLQETVFHDRYNIELTPGDLVANINDIIVVRNDDQFYPTSPIGTPQHAQPAAIAA